MFRCYFCHEVTPPGTKRQNVVIATREKTYPARRREAKRSQNRFRNRREATTDAGGKGVETKQEVPACPGCAAKQQEMAIPPSMENDLLEKDLMENDLLKSGEPD